MFKLLFGDEANKDLLTALLNDVLSPRSPIIDVTVTNPGIPKDAVDDRGLTVDITRYSR